MKITRPNRVTRSYTQRLAAEPGVVFPLLSPVREADWIEGWDPSQVISSSGIAEPDCVFVTRAQPHDAIWYVTRHEPSAGFRRDAQDHARRDGLQARDTASSLPRGL